MGIIDHALRWLREIMGVKSPSRELSNALAQARIPEGFTEGLRKGKENPRFWFDDSGEIHVRKPTPEETEALITCREIVARAFPGFYEDFEED